MQFYIINLTSEDPGGYGCSQGYYLIRVDVMSDSLPSPNISATSSRKLGMREAPPARTTIFTHCSSTPAFPRFGG